MGEFEKVSVAPNEKEAFTTITLNSGVKPDGKLFDLATRESNKRKRMEEDELSDATVAEIIAKIEDSKYMTGPNVSILRGVKKVQILIELFDRHFLFVLVKYAKLQIHFLTSCISTKRFLSFLYNVLYLDCLSRKHCSRW